MIQRQTLKELCHPSTDSLDLFVGIRFIHGSPSVYFPHGFRFSDNDKECRNDILTLLSVLKRFSQLRDGEMGVIGSRDIVTFPFTAYQYIIYNFLQKGYYSERESYYTQAPRGKIHWKKTIQRERPILDRDNVIYTKFQTKNSRLKEHDLLSQIHRHCVYESFYMLGWLYSLPMSSLEKPQLVFNKELFIHTLSQALNNTFEDEKRKLFQSMIQIIRVCVEGMDKTHLDLGVTRFAPIWEKIVDYIFGTEIKSEDYFPKAKWHLLERSYSSDSSALIPDTIMSHGNVIYILDAKYYKYGITFNTSDLPASSSVQKQITYGKHIEASQKKKVYNAFIMPYNSEDTEIIKAVAVSTSSWEKYNKQTENYKYVLGMLLDTKWAIMNLQRNHDDEIETLSKLIVSSLADFRRSFDKN